MLKLKHIAILSAGLIFSGITAHANTVLKTGELMCGSSIYGAWVTNQGNSVVNIRDCEMSGICGEIVKFANGKDYNALMSESSTPLTNIKGQKVLNEFHAKSDKKFKGRIFNPRNGKSYKSTLKLSKMGNLKVKGCLGPICETKIWVRPQSCQS